MKRGLVLDYRMLERLTDKPDYENIVVGTGALARDMRKKMLLLGLKAPFLIGDRSEPEKGIRHYREIAGLGEPKRYRFIMCCDVDEWELIAPAQMAAFRFLGILALNHPQLIEFRNLGTRWGRAGKQINDAMNGSCFLRGNHPYTLFGDETDENSFKIHIMGSCQVGGVSKHTPNMPSDIVYTLLRQTDFRCAVYAWGQPVTPYGDGIIHLIRDICFHKCDLLIFYSTLCDEDPLMAVIKNTLATRADSARSKHTFIQRLQSTYDKPVSNGIDHDVDVLTPRLTRQRLVSALSRLRGFAFWDVIAPAINLLPEGQARILGGHNPGYRARQRKIKNNLLSVLDNQYTRDYTEIFGAVDDIHSMFVDARHLSDEGNRIVAKRLAADILEAFGKQSEGVSWKN